MVNEVTPVPPDNTAPPEAAAYQSITSPAEALAVNVTVPVPQREAPVPVGADGEALIVTLAVSVAVQPPALVAVNV